jgi:hypothetical protein
MVTQWKTDLQRSLIETPALRWGLLIGIGLLLLASSVGLFVSYATPTRAEETTVLEHEQRGSFDYEVHLKPNDFFEEPKLGARQLLVMELADQLDITFAYDFQASQTVERQSYEHQIVARFGDPELYEKETPVMDPITTSDPSFSTTFSISIPEYISLTKSFREQTGVALDPAALTVVARTQPWVDTAHGSIEEPFEHRLRFAFDGATIRRDSDLEESVSGTMAETRDVPILSSAQRQWLRIGSGAGLVISVLLLSGVIWLQAEIDQQTSAAEKELQRARRRAEGLLIHADEPPPLTNGHVVTRVNSLDDLLDLANETLRPIIYSPNGQGYVYCAIDGSSGVRYTYKGAKRRQEDGAEATGEREEESDPGGDTGRSYGPSE